MVSVLNPLWIDLRYFVTAELGKKNIDERRKLLIWTHDIVYFKALAQCPYIERAKT